MTGHYCLSPLPDPRPLYAQIKASLREQIIDGTYGEHERIPSEYELMSSFGVSRITVRKALDDLEQERLIFKVPGKGAFVSKPKPFQELARLQGFGEAMSRLGYQTRNRVVSFETVAANEIVACRLVIPPGSPVSEIRRVRYLDHEPISLDISYLPTHLGERLAHEDLFTRDIFMIIENDYGTPLGHAELSIEAAVADAGLSALLGISTGAPILRIERLTHSANGTPLDFEYLYYRGNAFSYQLRIERG